MIKRPRNMTVSSVVILHESLSGRLAGTLHLIKKGHKMSIYSKKTRKTFAIIVCVVLVLALIAPLLIYVTNL